MNFDEFRTVKSILFLFAFTIAIFAILGGVLYAKGDGDNLGQSTASIIIDDAPKHVFEWVSSPNYTARWIKRLKKANKISKGSLKKGSLVRETVDLPKKTLELTGKIMGYEREHYIHTKYYISGETLSRNEFVPQKRGSSATDSFLTKLETIKLNEDQTRVVYTIQAKYNRWYTRFLEPLVTSQTEEAMQENLESLKKKIEASRVVRLKRERKQKERDEKRREDRKNKNEKNKKKSNKSGKQIKHEKKSLEKLPQRNSIVPNIPFLLDGFSGGTHDGILNPKLDYKPKK